MNDLNDVKAYRLNSTQEIVSANIIKDSSFGKCALLSSSADLSFGSMASNHLDGDDFTYTVWLKVDEARTQFNFLDSLGWQLVANGTLKIMGHLAPENLVVHKWQHLCVTKKGDSFSFYLDGVHKLAIESSVWSTALLTDEPVSYHCCDGQVSLAHQHFYRRELTVKEILIDCFSNKPSVYEEFADIYPLDISLINPLQNVWKNFVNNLMIVDAEPNAALQQAVAIKNINEEAIHFLPLASETADKNNFHFEVKFRNGTFFNQGQFPDFSTQIASDLLPENMALISPSDWIISAPYQNSSDASWSVFFIRKCSDEGVNLTANDSLIFPFSYSTADATLGERASQIAFNYQYLSFSNERVIYGDRSKQINIMNFSSNNAYISALNNRVSVSDKKVNDIEKILTEKVSMLEEKRTLTTVEKEEIRKQFTDAEQQAYAATKEEDKNKFLAAFAQKDIVIDNAVEAIDLLVRHGIALDNEVDARGLKNNERFEVLEALYPFTLSCQLPKGQLAGQQGAVIDIFLYNRLDTAVSFGEGDVKIKLPFGTHGLSPSYEDLGHGILEVDDHEFYLDKSQGVDFALFSSGGQLNDIRINPGQCIKFQLLALNFTAAPRVSFIDVDILGLKNQQNTKLSAAITLINADLSNIIGQNNVGVGTNTPKAKLDIEGDLRVSEQVTIAQGLNVTGEITAEQLTVDTLNIEALTVKDTFVFNDTTTMVVNNTSPNEKVRLPNEGLFFSQHNKQSESGLFFNHNSVVAFNADTTGFFGVWNQQTQNYNFKVSGDGTITLKNKVPIFFQRYQLDKNNSTQQFNTQILVNDYNASVAGFFTGWTDIEESDGGNFMKIRMEIINDTWYICTHLRTHGNDEKKADWHVDVMFVKKEMSTVVNYD